MRIETETRSERLELEQSKAISVALAQELAVIRDQITNKKAELAATSVVSCGARDAARLPRRGAQAAGELGRDRGG